MTESVGTSVAENSSVVDLRSEILSGLATINCRGLNGGRHYHPECSEQNIELQRRLLALSEGEAVLPTLTAAQKQLAQLALREELSATLDKPNRWSRLDSKIHRLKKAIDFVE